MNGMRVSSLSRIGLWTWLGSEQNVVLSFDPTSRLRRDERAPNRSASRLLIHPLAPEAGGDLFHSGGRQFESQNDPDWKILDGLAR
jgi:hypothetical protein